MLYGECNAGSVPGTWPGGNQGKNHTGATPIHARHAVLFGPGETLTLLGGQSDSRLVVVSGKPLHEPVAWGGPIVMNTEKELRHAFMELENGKFIKHP